MINLNFYKNKYFKDQILISSTELLDNFRNYGIKNDHQINTNNNCYKNYDTIDLLKIISDKVFFYQTTTQSIKNMLYQYQLYYQDFNKESQLESYLYRLIRENINRVLIFTGEFATKNNPKLISQEQKEELINNMDNDIIYLSDKIILVRYQVFLPWLWKCRKDPLQQLNNLTASKYYLKNQWDFSN